MKNNVILPICIVILTQINLATAHDYTKYTPSKEPLLKIATPKPNLYISMSNDTNIANDFLSLRLMTVPEHRFGPGDPICEERTGDLQTEWNQLKAKYKAMEDVSDVKYYDPFQTGRYKPYLQSEIGSVEYERYVGAIPIERCRTDVYPASIYTELFPEIIKKYSKGANLGFGGYGGVQLPSYRSTVVDRSNKGGHPGDYCAVGTVCHGIGYHHDVFKSVLYDGGDFNAARDAIAYENVDRRKNDARYDIFMQPITDMSGYTSDDWKEIEKKIRYKILGEYIDPKTRQREYFLGLTNTYSVLYYLSLYFRGYPIVESGYVGTSYVFNSPYGLRDIKVHPSPIIYEAETEKVEEATIIDPNNPGASSTKVGIIQSEALVNKAKLIN